MSRKESLVLTACVTLTSCAGQEPDTNAQPLFLCALDEYEIADDVVANEAFYDENSFRAAQSFLNTRAQNLLANMHNPQSPERTRPAWDYWQANWDDFMALQSHLITLEGYALRQRAIASGDPKHQKEFCDYVVIHAFSDI